MASPAHVFLRGAGRSARRSAFTLLELIVVISIMVVVLSAILVAASAMSTKAKSSSTRAVLVVVQNAVDQFEREQRAHPTLCRDSTSAKPIDKYTKRYGFFPPDELEVFSNTSANPVKRGGTKRTLAPGGATVSPKPPYQPMKFYSKGLTFTEAATEHRDLAAMILAIELYGEASSTMLDGIQKRYRTAGVLDDKGEPVQFLDRKPFGTWKASDDQQIRLIIDDWGNPISYLAQRNWTKATEADTVSQNQPGWNEASTEILRLNGNRPVIFSYGPDGAEQLSKDVMNATGEASLVGDFAEPAPKPHGVIDHPFNDDNVYADPGLKERLATERPQSP